MDQIKAWLKAYDRAKSENERIYKRSGYLGIYLRLLKSDNYTAKREKEILNADTEDILRLISLENATIV